MVNHLAHQRRWIRLLPAVLAALAVILSLSGCVEDDQFSIGGTAAAWTQQAESGGGVQVGTEPTAEPTAAGQAPESTGEPQDAATETASGGALGDTGSQDSGQAGAGDSGEAAGQQAGQPATGQPVAFNPPKPEEAPESIREAVLYGHEIIMDTPGTLPDYVGNSLSCTNCHFNGGYGDGSKGTGISMIGVGAVYPMYRARQEYAVNMVVRMND